MSSSRIPPPHLVVGSGPVFGSAVARHLVNEGPG